MRYRGVLTAIVATIILAGCSKSDIVLPSGPNMPDGYEPSTNVIAFKTADNWGDDDRISRSAEIVEGFEAGDKIGVYAYYINGDESTPAKWSAAAMPNLMNNQEVNYNGTTWSYSPLRYWPSNSNDKISFISVYPYNGVVYQADAVTGKYTFKHAINPFAEYNNDILMGNVLNATESVGSVDLSMKNVLTRINIEVAAINAPQCDAENQTLDSNGVGTGEYDVEYTVNSVTFDDVLLEGEVVIDEDDGSFSWSVDPSSHLYVTATQDNTLMAHDDPMAVLTTTSIENTAANKYTYNSVCKKNEAGESTHAIFVMPQDIEGNSYGTTPTVQLHMRKSYIYYSTVYDEKSNLGYRDKDGVREYKYLGEVIYVPDAIALPTPMQKGWTVGSNITMRFAFNLDASNPTPLTVLSMIYEYSDVDVDINVNRNLYIYTDQNDPIMLDATDDRAKMNFYTNYSETLTEPKYNVELDGSTTTAHGFVFYPASYAVENHNHWTPASTGIVENGYEKYTVTSPDPAQSTNSFSYWLKESNRKDEGCYVGTDGTGINKMETDDVYLLELVVEDSKLKPCNASGDTSVTEGGYGVMSGDIAVEMLSNAGGLIAKIFPIKVIKKLN